MVRYMWSLVKVILFGCLFMTPLPGQAKSEPDEGYFLSLKQKGQLIWRGEIYDGRGNIYDILICPGYVPPTSMARRSFSRGGDKLAEYVHAGKYRRAWHNVHDVFEWTSKDCLQEFTIKGTYRACKSALRADP